MENKYENKSLMDVLSSSKEKIENVRKTLGTLQKELSDYYLSSVQNTDGIPESQKEAMASMRLLLNDALGNLSNSVKSVKALTGEKEEKAEEKKYPLLNEIVKQQFEDKDAMYIFKEDEENYCIYGEKAIRAAKILDVEPWLKDVTIGTKTDKALPLPVMSIEHFLNILEVAGIDTKLQKEDMTFETRKSPLKQIDDLAKKTGMYEGKLSSPLEFTYEQSPGKQQKVFLSYFELEKSAYDHPLLLFYDDEEHAKMAFDPFFYDWASEKQTREKMTNAVFDAITAAQKAKKDVELHPATEEKEAAIEEKTLEDKTASLYNAVKETGLEYHPIALLHSYSVEIPDEKRVQEITHVMVSENGIRLYENQSDAFDDRNSFFLGDFNNSEINDILDETIKILSNDENRVSIQISSDNVPDYALSPLVNGDYSGIEDAEDEKNIRNYEDYLIEFPDCVFVPRDEEPSFTNNPAFGLPCNCVKCDIIRTVSIGELKKERLQDFYGIFFEKYNGKDYPARLVNINGEDLKVASEELNEVLRNTTYQEYIDAEARKIGEDIYYFVPTEKLYLPEEELVPYVKNTMRNEKLLYSTLAQESLFDKVLDVPEEIKADFKGETVVPNYVVFDDSFPLRPCFYYSYNDAEVNASYPTKKSQIPDNFFEKINKRLNSSEPIRFYLPSVDIPVYAVKALTDGKLDGLTEKEKKDISAYIGKTGAGIIYARNEIDKPIHLPFPAFGPAADCQVLDRYVNVVPRELKDVYVSDDGRLHPKKYTMNPNYDGTFNVVLLHDIGNIPTLMTGEIGGVIHSEKNLSHEGRCWVFPGGEVSGQARGEGDAFVEDGGKVEVFARVEGAATIRGRVGGNAKISGDTVVEKSEIIGYDSFLDDFRQGEAEDIDEAENIHRGR